MIEMKTLVLGRTLSFPNVFDGGLPSTVNEICHLKEETNTYYLQAPKIDKLNQILGKFGYAVSLDEQGKKSYDQSTRVRVTYDAEKTRFLIHLPSYPSYPRFRQSERKKWIWKNMARRLTKDLPVYEVKYLYLLIEATEWLKSEGYDVSMSDQVKSFLPPTRSDLEKIVYMRKDGSFELKYHQIDCVDKIEKMGWKGIIGDDAGLGKTITGGEIIWRLFQLGLVRRVIWVVPTSPLVHQVHEEMKGRYNLEGVKVTGETVKPRERLGMYKKQVIDKTIYEKHGFVITTWAMFVRDFSGKTFHEVTKKVHFDLAILDEGHRTKYGNRAFDAVLNLSAPFRIILSGTIMPNGDWRELHNMVSAICPSFVMAMWYFSNLEDKKAEDFSVMRRVEHPRHEAKKMVTGMVLSMLMKKVTRHTKEECAGSLPEMGEVSMHVATNPTEEKIIDEMITMLSDIIGKWQSLSHLKKGTKAEKQYYMIVENAKNVVWQDLRRFCSHGAFRLKDRMEEILAGSSPVHDWLNENYAPDLRRVRSLLLNEDVRLQPKNPKVLSVLNRATPERSMVFYNSVKGCIELGKYLTENGLNVKIIVGSDDQFNEDDAEIIGQSHNIKDKDIEEILEWFWFPWKTVASLSKIEGLDVTYIDSRGNERKSLYYVDGYKLGKEFKVVIKWNEKIPRAISLKLREKISMLYLSPSISMSKTIGPEERESMLKGEGEMVLDFKLTKSRDNRVLIATDKLNEGANLQIANLEVFYDSPMSIKQKEQRIARLRRMESAHKSVAIVSILCGLDYAIERSLGMKYETAKQLGYPDPNPVTMKEVLEMVKRKQREKPKKEQPNILDFLGKGEETIDG